LIFEYELSQSVTVLIKIYRLTGELVAEIGSGSTQFPGITCFLSWNGKNKNGLDLPNGLYLVKVNVTEDNGIEKDGLSHPKLLRSTNETDKEFTYCFFNLKLESRSQF